MNIFDTIFYQPLLKALLFFYELQPAGLGGAVILMTAAIKVLLFPLNKKSIDSQKALSKLQPKLKKVQKEHKDDKEKMGREVMALYKEAGINPFSSILLLVVQTPILIALYQVFRQAPGREGINPFFLGINLSEPNTILALAGAALLFVQMKITSADTPAPSGKDGGGFQASFQKQMQYIFPVFIFFVLIKVPSAIGVYLVVSGVLSVLEKKLIDALSGGK